MFGLNVKDLLVLGIYIYVIFKVLKKGQMTEDINIHTILYKKRKKTHTVFGES